MPDSGSHELLNFIATVQSYVPGLVGRVGSVSDDEIVLANDNTANIQRVLTPLLEQYPEAGPSYGAVRTWGLLTWQPVMLSLASAYGFGKVLSLSSLGQHVQPAMVAGYTLESDVFAEVVGDANHHVADHHVNATMIQAVGAQLKQYCDSLKAELMAISVLKSIRADRLLADRILSTLILMRPYFFKTDTTTFDDLCRQWLAATGLSNASAVMAFALPDGSEQVALNRKGCCLHYRRCDGDLCVTCPRQKMSERIQRLKDDWSEHAAVN